jgi:hypothetical protein
MTATNDKALSHFHDGPVSNRPKALFSFPSGSLRRSPSISLVTDWENHRWPASNYVSINLVPRATLPSKEMGIFAPVF